MKRITLAAAAMLAVSGTAIAANSLQSPSLPTMTVAMDGTSITVGGTLESGAVNIVSTTTREKEGDLLLVRLNPGVTAAQLLAAADSPDVQHDLNNLARYGAIVVNAAAPRGISAVQTVLQPGQYAAADAAGDKLPSQQPYTVFTITAAAHPAALPKPKATVSAIDFAFTGQKRLHTGDMVRFVNRGHLAHMIILERLARGADPGAVITLLRQGKTNEAQKFVTGGFQGQGPVVPGASQQMKLTAGPGTYLAVCFMETQDGRDHMQLNMVRVIDIVK